MKLTKTLSSIVVALALVASAFAVNYDNHQGLPRLFKVGLGSGNAPSAADAATYGLTQGSFVLNTDDDVLFIMHNTNVYTKISSAGAATITSIVLGAKISGTNITANTLPLSAVVTGIPANILIYGANTSLSQVALSGPVTVSTSGVTTVTSVNANAIGSTNIAANSLLAEDYAALSVDEAAITNGAVTGGKIASDTVTSGNISNGNWYVTGMSTAQVTHIEHGSLVVPGSNLFTRAYTQVPTVIVSPTANDIGATSNWVSELTTTGLIITNGSVGTTSFWFTIGY